MAWMTDYAYYLNRVGIEDTARIREAFQAGYKAATNQQFPTMNTTWDKHENVDRQGGAFAQSEIDNMCWK